LRRFHELSSNELAALDIAEVNLECATHLPGSENLDIPAALSTLNEWAEAIHRATIRHWPRFEQNPSEFEDSIPYFCMLVMATVLQRDLGVHYNLKSLEEPYDGTDSRLHFIHGILEGNGGTCETVPSMFPLAVGSGIRWHLSPQWNTCLFVGRTRPLAPS